MEPTENNDNDVVTKITMSEGDVVAVSEVPATENQNDDDKNLENECKKISSVPSKTETVEFKVIYSKQKFDVTFPLEETISNFKKHVESLTGLQPAMQKVMFKGLAKDNKTLKEIGVTNGAKIMIIGSTLNDVMAVNTPTPSTAKDDKAEEKTTSEPFCQQKMHRKVLDKGLPEDVMPGILNLKEKLPQFPISGMLNKTGNKVRLTFKLENDEVWIGTKGRTDKVKMHSIKTVVSEPIEGFEQYHLMALQLGPTEASRYWLYWVPAQYVDAIKDMILGKWQFF